MKESFTVNHFNGYKNCNVFCKKRVEEEIVYL